MLLCCKKEMQDARRKYNRGQERLQESEIKRSTKSGSLMTEVHKNGRNAQPTLYWGTKEMITLNSSSSDHVPYEVALFQCQQACLITTHNTAKFILAQRECPLALGTQMKTLYLGQENKPEVV